MRSTKMDSQVRRPGGHVARVWCLVALVELRLENDEAAVLHCMNKWPC